MSENTENPLNKTPIMPQELEAMVENLTGFQRKYCEFRSKGMTQSLSAQKAGSEVKDSASRGRVGYQIEQMPGVKEYIHFLQEQRSKVVGVDELEIIQKIRAVYEAAMASDCYKEANVSAKLLGETIGLFGKADGRSVNRHSKPQDAFEEDNEGVETEDRIKRLQGMMRDLNKMAATPKED